MAAALRTQTANSGSGDVAATLTGVQSGDLLICCIHERDGAAITGVSDTVNGSWTQAVTRAITAARVAIFYFQNSGAGNPVITVDQVGAAPMNISTSAWSGCATTGGADTTGNAGNSSTTSHTHGSVTPSASALLITVCGGGALGADTLNTGFTMFNRDTTQLSGQQFFAYKATHTGALNPTHTSANTQSTDGVVAAFLEAGGGGGTAVPVFVHNLRQQGIL